MSKESALSRWYRVSSYVAQENLEQYGAPHSRLRSFSTSPPTTTPVPNNVLKLTQLRAAIFHGDASMARMATVCRAARQDVKSMTDLCLITFFCNGGRLRMFESSLWNWRCVYQSRVEQERCKHHPQQLGSERKKDRAPFPQRMAPSLLILPPAILLLRNISQS